jgi:hypothetical protein
MKKKLNRLLILMVILFSVSAAASAQVYVRVHPVAPVVVVRPPQPSPEHVWVDDEWEPTGETYVYTGGHWDRPPHPHYRYHHGYWGHYGNRGDRWHHGRWRRHY